MPASRESRSFRRGTSFPRNAGTSVQQAVERLNEASASLSSLLEQPPRQIMDPDPREREYSGEAEVNRRRAKRRKVETEPQLSPHYKGFSYGYRGQVVPGPLKMEIVSCDGGVHPTGLDHEPENVLRNDKSVYCTQSNECNIILRHQFETPFTLKKLIIKGPEKGFTSPIQEGMIFVSMDSHELLPRTNAYRICEDPSSPPAHYQDTALLEDLPVLDLDTGELLFDDHRPPSRRADGTTRRAIPAPVSNSQPTFSNHYTVPTIQNPRPSSNRGSRRGGGPNQGTVPDTPAPIPNSQPAFSNHYTVPAPQMPAPSSSSESRRHGPMLGIRRPRDTLVPPTTLHRAARVLPGPVPTDTSSDEDGESVIRHLGPTSPPPPMDNFTVTTDCSEPTSDVEEPSSAAVMADLHRRDRADFYAEDSDNESMTEDPEIAHIISQGRARLSGGRLAGSSRHDLRREMPSRIEVMHDWDAGHGSEHGPLANQGLTTYEKCMIETKAQMKGVLAPHARFFIEKEASCVTVNFEPAISGRFILVKMWSPPKLHNVDIQSIVVHGFAGPRFFPAAQPL